MYVCIINEKTSFNFLFGKLHFIELGTLSIILASVCVCGGGPLDPSSKCGPYILMHNVDSSHWWRCLYIHLLLGESWISTSSTEVIPQVNPAPDW